MYLRKQDREVGNIYRAVHVEVIALVIRRHHQMNYHNRHVDKIYEPVAVEVGTFWKRFFRLRNYDVT